MCSKVKTTYRNIKFKIISKHEEEWENYVKEICKMYGFKDKLDPICFTPQGHLIGGTEQFKQLLQDKLKVEELQLNQKDETNEAVSDSESLFF